LHIVEKKNVLYPSRAPFSVNSVHGRLVYEDKIFVSLGRGYYALVNWGIQRAPFIKDFLAEAVRKRGGTAEIDELVAEGKSKYGYKETSLRMTLSMNPRIFKVKGDGR
jgi:hypothetical protein